MSSPNDDPHAVCATLLDTINSAIENRRIYHDHKEKMAWTATSLYMASILFVAKQVQDVVAADSVRTSIATIFICLFWYLVHRFVNMQFDGRWIAANHDIGLCRFRSQLLAEPNLARQLTIPKATAAPADANTSNTCRQEFTDDSTVVWPSPIEDKIKEAEKEYVRPSWRELFGKVINGANLGRRESSEFASFSAISLSSLLAILILWQSWILPTTKVTGSNPAQHTKQKNQLDIPASSGP